MIEPDDLERQVTPLAEVPRGSMGSTRPTAGPPPGAGPFEVAQGTRVGRYVLLERLGRGGMGEVHRAYDPELDRRLALKLEHALVLAERNYGRDHPLTATLLQNLGGLLAEQGKLDQAESPLLRALEIRRRSLGPEHAEVATALNNLGGLKWELGQREAARQLLREALEIQQAALGRDHIRHVPLLHNLAEMQLEDGQVAAARQDAERALALIERFREPSHPRLVLTLTVLGRISTAEGQIDEGRALLRRAIGVVEEQIGPDNPISAAPRQALGELELAAGKPTAAIEALSTALALREGSGHSAGGLAPLRFSLARAKALRGAPAAEVRALAEHARDTAEDAALQAEIDAWLRRLPASDDLP